MYFVRTEITFASKNLQDSHLCKYHGYDIYLLLLLVREGKFKRISGLLRSSVHVEMLVMDCEQPVYMIRYAMGSRYE